MGSLPADQAASYAPTRRARGLSRRRVRALVRIGQWWEAEDGDCWRLQQIHRHDGLVRLERPGDGRRFVTFGELGSKYRLQKKEDDQ